MSIQNAMNYIRHVREHEDARDEIRRLGSSAGMAALTRLGLARGFEFSEEELRRAHVIDWEMRARAYSSQPG